MAIDKNWSITPLKMKRKKLLQGYLQTLKNAKDAHGADIQQMVQKRGGSTPHEEGSL